MQAFLFYTVVVALVAAFGLTLLRKWQVIEWVQVHRNEFLAKMFNFDLCLSFWAGIALAILLAFITGNPTLLLVPFCSTMITRFLL